MESFRRSVRQSLYIETPQGSCCRKALCGLLLLLACRWFVVVWQLRVIVPLPLIYGIAVLPVLTLVGLMVPMLFSAGDGCGCAGSGCQWLCSERARKVVSVLCATLDVALSLGLSGGLVYLVNGLATEPDQSLNVYWSGTLRSFVFVLIESILAFLLYVALAVQGHCCAQRGATSCGVISIELTPVVAADGGNELRDGLIDDDAEFGHTDSAKSSPRRKGVKRSRCGLMPSIRLMSDEEKLSAALLLIYSTIAAFQLILFALALWQWKMHDGLQHANSGIASPPCGDPLVGNYAPCALPFPSDYLLEVDPPSATGYRVAMTSESIPLSRWDGKLSPAAWNAQDGFSTVSPVLFAFAPKENTPIDASSLIPHTSIEVSMNSADPSMTTILLDADNGELVPAPQHYSHNELNYLTHLSYLNSHQRVVEQVPHWVDVDQYHLDYGGDLADGRPPLLILQPAKPLRHNTTYIVGVRGLTAKGVAVPAESAFAAVRDCVPEHGCDPSAQLAQAKPAIAWPRTRTDMYNSLVFPKLEAKGFHRSHLQLAWWYKTVSVESSLGVAKHIRDQSLASVPLHGQPLPSGQSQIEPVVDKVTDYTCRTDDVTGNDGSWGGSHGVHIGRTVWGHFMAPTYLRRAGPGYHTFYNFPSTEKPMDSQLDPAGHSIGGPWWARVPTDLGAGAGQRSSGDGARAMPTRLDGEGERVGWVARIPCSVLQRSRRGVYPFVLQYGHGLFGSRDEVNAGYLSKIANENGWVLVALDWSGMAQYDVPQAIRIMTARFDEFASMPQRTVQGWAYSAMLMRLMGTEAMSKLPAFQSPTTKTSMLSPSRYAEGARTAQQALEAGNIRLAGPLTAGYYGNSQGSVVGCGYCAYQRDIRRCTCGVPGCPFALILSRSADFAPYYTALKLQFTHAQDIRLAITLLQVLWDQGESGGWLQEMAPKQVLLQAGIGDAQVNNLGAELMARGYSASTMKPQTRHVYGVPEREDTFDGSALVEWRYDDVPDSPAADIGRTDGKDVHECPRREPAAQRQMQLFLQGGNVTQQCCDSAVHSRCHQVKCESKSCPSNYGPWPDSPLPWSGGGGVG